MKSLWPSCIVAGCGPSLERFDHSGIRLIAINDSWQLFPSADILYAADLIWWQQRKPEFGGCKISVSFEHDSQPGRNDKIRKLGVRLLPGKRGRCLSAHGAIQYGKNGGFQAIQIAMRLSRLIILVGFDMKGTHFFGAHTKPLRQKSNYDWWIAELNEAARGLPKGYRIINATPGSALECFERMSLEEALNEGRKAR